MTEEEKVVTGENVEIDNTDYINAIKELKQNSVDRSKYDALKAENKKLLDAVVNGTEVAQEVVEPKKSIEELRHLLFNPEGQTDVEYMKNVLELRERLIEEEGYDPFAGVSTKNPQGDYVTANKVAQIMSELVEDAEGSDTAFHNGLDKRLVPSPMDSLLDAQDKAAKGKRK